MSHDDERRDPSGGDQPNGENATRLDELRGAAGEEAQRLQHGATVSLLGATVPVRVLQALGLFVLVFMLVWIALWVLAGGAGLGLGWIPAALAGVLAIRIAGLSIWS